MGPVQDSVSQINGDKDGLTFCGKRLFKIIDGDSVKDFITIDSETATLVIEPTEES